MFRTLPVQAKGWVSAMNHEANISRADFLRKFPAIFLQELKPFWEEQIGPTTTRSGVTHECLQKESQSGALIPRVDISRCLAWGQMECQLCYLACPLREQAIQIHDQKPVIIASSCDGCGFCQQACQTVNDLIAIQIVRKNI